MALENSLAAFRLAAEAGADGIELDVHSTSDGHFVVHHDPALPGAGPIGGLTLAQIRKRRLSNGEAIPVLEEAMEVAGQLRIWVEVKALDPAHDSRLVQLLSQADGFDRCAVHSFDHRIIRRLASRHPGLRCGALLAAYLLDPVRELERTGAVVLWQEWNLVDQGLVDRVHETGRAIIAWTVDEPAELSRLAAMGIDGLCTNVPDAALRALGRRG